MYILIALVGVHVVLDLAESCTSLYVHLYCVCWGSCNVFLDLAESCTYVLRLLGFMFSSVL